MAQQFFAVVLNGYATPELLALVKDNLRSDDPSMKYLLCTELDFLGSFLRVRLAQGDIVKLEWVQIPTGCVAAIAELSQAPAVGFLSSNR